MEKLSIFYTRDDRVLVGRANCNEAGDDEMVGDITDNFNNAMARKVREVEKNAYEAGCADTKENFRRNVAALLES